MLSKYAKIPLVLFILLMIGSCVTKVYPVERLAIDPDFLTIFNSSLQKDTINFKNSIGKNKAFVITKIDSVVSNEKGWFINERPYKALTMSFREIGEDTTPLERVNELYVGKDPVDLVDAISIKFNNLYFSDTILPQIHHDTISINNKKITNYYLFETLLSSKSPDDVKVLFINVPKGIVGFKTFSGEAWINEVD